MLSSGTFCSDEDMVITILHPHQQSLIVPSLRQLTGLSLLLCISSLTTGWYLAQCLIGSGQVFFVCFFTKLQKPQNTVIQGMKNKYTLLYTFRLWFAFSSPFTVITFVQTSAFTSSIRSFVLDFPHFVSYWIYKFYSVATTFSELSLGKEHLGKYCVQFLKITINLIQFWKLKIDCLIPAPPLALLCYNEVWFLTQHFKLLNF